MTYNLYFQSANLAASKMKSTRPPLIEAASGWSNDNQGDDDDDNNEYVFTNDRTSFLEDEF